MVEQDSSFLSKLFEKLANMKKIESEAGISTQAAQREALRQITQASKGGDPIKGKGVTKSGKED